MLSICSPKINLINNNFKFTKYLKKHKIGKLLWKNELHHYYR